MDIDSSPPPQSAAEPIDSSTPPTDLPPSPPDTNTISDIRGTVMDGDAEEREESLPIGLDISMDMDRVGSSSSHASAAGTGNGTGGKNDTTASDPTPIPSTPVTVSTPQPHKSKISLRFRQPALNADLTGGESSGPSRASTPGSGTGTGGRKRKSMPKLLPNNVTELFSNDRSSSRADSPLVAGQGSEAGPSPAPSGHDTNGALSIFAPPVSSTLPEALQSVIGNSKSKAKSTNSTPGPSTSTPARTNGDASTPSATGTGTGSGRELRVRLNVSTPTTSTEAKGVEGDGLVKEAADGLATSKLRPTRGRDSLQKSGVSASGKGVKVGGGARVTVAQPKTAVSSATRKQPKPSEPQPNQDFCSACRGIGRFLCCDGCPRSFHFMCLEPPLRVDELPEEDNWYCRKCKTERKPRKRSPPPSADKEVKPIPAVFKQLIKTMESDNPEQFRLPEHVRTFFTGVGTGARGEYLDAEESRTKYDRKGFQEERDSHRLRDGKAKIVACYACGGSSIPIHALTTDPGAPWRPIVSCDYCSLSWHLDCLNPPMPSMPNAGRKWMCPNHAEQVMRKRRTVREKLEIVDIDKEGSFNNGNITVVPDEPVRPPMQFEDLIINRKKFRIPEKIIKLDFWSKLGYAGKKRKRAESEVSDLTSLADDSADDEASPPPRPEPFLPVRLVHRTATREDLDAANLVLSLFSNGRAPPNAATQPPLHSDPVPSNPTLNQTQTPVKPANGNGNGNDSTPMNGASGSGSGTRSHHRRQSTLNNGSKLGVPGSAGGGGNGIRGAVVKDEPGPGPGPVNLASMDLDESEPSSIEPEAPRKKILLKFKAGPNGQ